MRSLMLTHQHERLVWIPCFQPRQRVVSDNVGAITFIAFSRSVHLDEVGVVVRTLPRQNFPMVEPCWIARQMPLADHRRLIPHVLHQFRKRRLSTVKPVAVPQKTVLVAMLPGQNARSRRTTNGIRTKRIAEGRSVLRDAIQVWCFVNF